MRIKNISNKRGIYLIYNGNKYVVLSEYYGVVAESTMHLNKYITMDLKEY